MQTMRDFLRGSLARSLHSAPDEDRLAAALPIVCGSALAAHCHVGRLDEEFTLHLEVLGREWLSPLLGMREMLQHDLARVAGVPLRGLHFEVPVAGRPASAPPTPEVPPNSGRAACEGTAPNRTRRPRTWRRPA